MHLKDSGYLDKKSISPSVILILIPQPLKNVNAFEMKSLLMLEEYSIKCGLIFPDLSTFKSRAFGVLLQEKSKSLKAINFISAIPGCFKKIFCSPIIVGVSKTLK